jgi:hypothetical protein
MTDISGSKRKSTDSKDESAEKKQKVMGPPEPRSPKPDPDREEAALAKALEENERKEPLPGVTVKDLIRLLNVVPVHTQGEGKVLWDRLCATAEGRQVLLNLYRALWQEHAGFVAAMQDYSVSARISADQIEDCESLNECEEHARELGDVQAYLADIENTADAIEGDVYRAQVAAATGDLRLDKHGY